MSRQAMPVPGPKLDLILQEKILKPGVQEPVELFYHGDIKVKKSAYNEEFSKYLLSLKSFQSVELFIITEGGDSFFQVWQ